MNKTPLAVAVTTARTLHSLPAHSLHGAPTSLLAEVSLKSGRNMSKMVR